MNTRIISIGAPVHCMAVMKGIERVACGSADGRIYVVDARRAVVEKIWEAHDKKINAMVFTTDGSRIISGSDDKTVKVWDANSGVCVTTFKGDTDMVRGVAVTGDGRRVISVSYDRCACVWDLETGTTLTKLTTVDDTVTFVGMLGKGEVAVVGGDYGELRMLSLSSSKQVGPPFGGDENRSYKYCGDFRRWVHW